MFEPLNLNNVWVDDAEGTLWCSANNSVISTDGQVSVYFRELEDCLINHIQKADCVLGCVAWLTSLPIIHAMAKRQSQIVVQKEDFLRPDCDQCTGWKQALQAAYSSMQFELFRFECGELPAQLSQCGCPSVSPIRCVGNHNSEKHPSSPRMHNKFLLFARLLFEDNLEFTRTIVEPYAVWTGSFNFSKNAGRSLENALYVTDPKIVDAYYREYQQILAISEPLDWESEWCTPQWRIGS